MIEVRWNYYVDQVMSQEDSSKAEDNRYYTFRISKRDVRGLAAVFTLWFLWSEGGEVARLFGNLFEALR